MTQRDNTATTTTTTITTNCYLKLLLTIQHHQQQEQPKKKELSKKIKFMTEGDFFRFSIHSLNQATEPFIKKKIITNKIKYN